MHRWPTDTPELNAAERDLNRRRAFDQARVRYPLIALTYEQFAAHLDRVDYRDGADHEPDAMYLCAACRLGSEAAREYFARAYFSPLKKALLDRYEAADFVGQVLHALDERLFAPPAPRIGTYQGVGSVHAWLCAMALRLASALLRSDGGRTWTVVDGPNGGSASSLAGLVASAVGQRQTEGALLSAIVALGPADRQLLHMRHVLGLRPEQIARCLGVCHSTVYRRIHCAEGRVRQAAVLSARLCVEDSKRLSSPLPD